MFCIFYVFTYSFLFNFISIKCYNVFFTFAFSYIIQYNIIIQYYYHYTILLCTRARRCQKGCAN